jgi:tetratricopeptide (TPR) repeat protein
MSRHGMLSVFALQLIVYLDVVAYAQQREYGMSNAARSAFEMCSVQLRNGEYREARRTAEKELRNEPTNPAFLEVLGMACVELRDYDRAMEAYTKAIRYGPRQPSVYHNRGNLYDIRKDWVHAIEDFSKAIEIAPSLPEPYYSRARCYLAQCQYRKAQADFEESYRRGFGNLAACGLAHLLATCPDTANRDGKRALVLALKICESTDYNNPFYVDVLAMAYAESGNWKEAVIRAEQAIKIAEKKDDVSEDFRRGLRVRLELFRLHEPFRRFPPEHPSDWLPSSAFEALHYGIAKIYVENYTGAASDIQKAVDLNPRLASAHYFLGYAKIQLGQTMEAIRYFDTCLKLDPRYSEGFADRSIACCMLGKFRDGLSDSKKALAQSPKNFSARLSHAWALGAMGDSVRALQELIQLNREFPDHDMIHVVRGDCYLRLGRYDDAVGEFTRAIQRNPRSALAYSDRAVALTALNKDKEAERDLRESIRLAPSFRDQTEERMKAMKEELRHSSKGQ